VVDQEHTFDPALRRQRGRWISGEFKASLVYMVGSRPARKSDPVSNKQTRNKQTNKCVCVCVCVCVQDKYILFRLYVMTSKLLICT